MVYGRYNYDGYIMGVFIHIYIYIYNGLQLGGLYLCNVGYIMVYSYMMVVYKPTYNWAAPVLLQNVRLFRWCDFSSTPPMLPWTSPKSASLSALSDGVFSWEKKTRSEDIR